MLCANGPILVRWLTGIDTVRNTVRFANSCDYVWIYPPCSSLSNVSLLPSDFGSIIVDLERRQVIDVLPDRAASSVEA